MTITELSNVASSYLNKIQSANGASASSPSANAPTGLQALFTQIQTDVQLKSKDFMALQTALKAGDLAGANTAFATVKQDFQNVPAISGVQSPLDLTTPVGKGFQALGNALQAGNLTAAQQALTVFRQDMHHASSFGSLYQEAATAVNSSSTGGQGSGLSSVLSSLGSGLNLNA